jgi:hypothetical protein
MIRRLRRWYASPGAARLIALALTVTAIAHLLGLAPTPDWFGVLEIVGLYVWAQDYGRKSERRVNSEAADLRAALDRMHLDGDR